MMPHDDERLSALYRAGDHEEPPAHLDQEIREAARRHAPRRHRGWIPALATAAVLVLAVAVMIRIPEEPMEESGHGTSKPAEEVTPAAPAVGSAARKEIPEGFAGQAKPGKTEQPPASRFEYYRIIPESTPAEGVGVPPENLRPTKPAPAAAARDLTCCNRT